jgi:hypothetical protein
MEAKSLKEAIAPIYLLLNLTIHEFNQRKNFRFALSNKVLAANNRLPLLPPTMFTRQTFSYICEVIGHIEADSVRTTSLKMLNAR